MSNVVVTGASRGLGLSIAERLVSQGHCVIAVARQNGPQLQQAIARTQAAGTGSLRFHEADLADLGAIPALAKALRRHHGHITGLVNNAGIGTSGLLANMRDAQIDDIMRLNVVSPITLTKHILRGMMTGRGGGQIVNLASIVGLSGFTGLAAYSASKAALIGFTRSLAREVGTLGITVNAVAPGFVETDLTQAMLPHHRDQIVRRSALKRLAQAEDVANTVEFLISDRARSITGTVITVDAGAIT